MGCVGGGPLEGLRILELPGPYGRYAGKLLADFGADVILVEPPGGAADRRAGPFIDDPANDDPANDDPANDDPANPGHSLTFAYFNTSKRGAPSLARHSRPKASPKYGAKPARPIMLRVPMDVQQKTMDDDAIDDYVPLAQVLQVMPTMLDPDDVVAVAKLIAASEKLVILVRRGAIASGAGEAVPRLAQRGCRDRGRRRTEPAHHRGRLPLSGRCSTR